MRIRRGTRYGIVVVLIAVFIACAGAAAAAAPMAAAADQRVRELATCAAYFFNATRARPMGEYERLYRAGERLSNRAARIVARADVDRLIAEASTVMTQMTGGDWRAFDRVSARYDAACRTLAEAASGAAASP